MPITPLHLGLMAPILHVLRGRRQAWMALASFTLVTLWIDMAAIFAWLEDRPLPSHDEAWHTMHGALLFAGFISLCGIASWGWVLGAFFGGISHILLDGMVHPEMQPFVDTEPGNSIYLGAMGPVSAALLPLTVWLIAQLVSSSSRLVRDRARRHRARRLARRPDER